MNPNIPDVPAPKPDDKDYMKLWHMYIEKDLSNIALQTERNVWKLSFYAVTFIIALAVLVLAVAIYIHL